jgi:hypothetical protein
MPKTAAPTKKSDRKNQLTQDDAKFIHDLLASIAGSYAQAVNGEDRRYHGKLTTLAAKVRRLY